LWVKAAAAGLALAVTVAVTLLGAGPAAAATELRLSPASGPPGTEFVISGTGFASAPVELHWGGQSGPIIASAVGPEFSVKATVPDAPPNSHPVVAVVTQGTSVSTSSASFQVTTGEVPAPVVEETTTTSTTVTPATTPPPTTATPSTAPAAIELPAAGGSSTDRRVSGGVDGGVGDTTDGGSTNAGAATAAPSAGAGSTPTSTVLTPPASVATTPTVTIAPGGGPGAAPPGGPVPSTAPLLPGDGVAAPVLTPARTNQSAGAVSNPALLFLGLGLVFGGGVFLAVRNRHRA
jgi:hypothetical protein